MRIKSVISLILVLVMLVSCGKAPSDTSETAEVITVTTTESTTEQTTTSEETTEDPFKKPLIEEFDDQVRLLTFYRDDIEIHGAFVYPLGAEKGPYKTIVLSSPLYTSGWGVMDRAYLFAEAGYACVVFDLKTNVDGAPTKYLGDFIYDQVKDLNCVMDSLKYLPDVDTSNVYMWAHSMGGLTTAYVGAARKNEVKGLILVEPSIQKAQKMKFENEKTLDTDIFSVWADLDIPVIIIIGSEGTMKNEPEFYINVAESLPKGKLVTVQGADHGMGGEYGVEMVRIALEAMESWNNNSF